MIKLLTSFTVFFLCSCSDANRDMSVPIKFGEEETRKLSLVEFQKLNIPYQEKLDGYVYVGPSDKERVVAIVREIGEQVLPREKSMSVGAERYESIRNFVVGRNMSFREVKSSGMVFFVFRTSADKLAVEQYVDDLVQAELIDLYGDKNSEK